MIMKEAKMAVKVFVQVGVVSYVAGLFGPTRRLRDMFFRNSGISN